MRTGNILFSAIHAIFLLILFLLGALLIGLGQAPHFREKIAFFVLNEPGSLVSIGYGVLVCAAVLFWGFYAMHRGAYFQLKMGKGLVEVEPAVIQSYVQSYWKEIFPEQEYAVEVLVLKSRLIEIVVEMPEMPEPLLSELLEKIESELSTLFIHSLGYQSDFLLTARCAQKKDISSSHSV